MKHTASALSVMHCEQGQAGERTHAHMLPLSHTLTLCRFLTHIHTPPRTCEAEAALFWRHTFPLSRSLPHSRARTHTWTRTVQLDSTEPGWTTVTHHWSLSHEQRRYSIQRKARLPASTHPLSPIPPPSPQPPIPLSLPPSIHSSLVPPAAWRQAWLKDTALRSAVVSRAAERVGEPGPIWGTDRVTALPPSLPPLSLCPCLSLHPSALSFTNVTSVSWKCWICQAPVFFPFFSQGAGERER